jgi:hypothetical protein
MGFRQKIACFELDTKWIHIVPMSRFFFQSRVQKNTHCHKGYDWLTRRKYYGSASTNKLRLIIIGFDTPTDNNSDKDIDSLAITSLASDVHDAGKGRGKGSGDCLHRPPWALAMEPLPPPSLAMAPRTSSTSLASLLLPLPTMWPKYVAQFSWTSIPFKMDICQEVAPLQDGRARVHTARHLCSRNTSSAN